MTQYIFVSGGVVSSLGKGITAASIGRLLKARDIKVSIQKPDPLSMSTLAPCTLSAWRSLCDRDGAETDLDLGHYERFTDEHGSREQCDHGADLSAK